MSKRMTFGNPHDCVYDKGYIEPGQGTADSAYIYTEDGESTFIPLSTMREYLAKNDPDYTDRVAELEAQLAEQAADPVETVWVAHEYEAEGVEGDMVPCGITLASSWVTVADADGDEACAPLVELRAALAKYDEATGRKDVDAHCRAAVEAFRAHLGVRTMRNWENKEPRWELLIQAAILLEAEKG